MGEGGEEVRMNGREVKGEREGESEEGRGWMNEWD
jgi:hypothetical protein